MVLLDTKTESTSSSPLNLNSGNKKDEPTLSFSELLKGISIKKEDKVIQNGALVLSLEGDKKEIKSAKTDITKENSSLLSLLKNRESSVDESKELLEINPKLSNNLDIKEMKNLISNAKEYLKSQILQSDGYKKSQIKELPQTLKGLAALANKFDIDVSKITVEDVKFKTKISSDGKVKEYQETSKVNLKVQNTKETHVKEAQNTNVKETHVKETQNTNVKETHVKETQNTNVKETHVKETQNTNVKETHVKETQNTNVKETHVKEAQNTNVKETHVKETQNTNVKETHVKETQNTNAKEAHVKEAQNTNIKETQLNKMSQMQISKEISETPLFKTLPQKEHGTQQLIQAKQFKVNEKTSKDRADETLKLLLKGNHSLKNENLLTADFAVATAKVIAPDAENKTKKTLEELLHSDSNLKSETLTTSKIDGLTVHKADSLEVKINEAKQMIKYLSNDVKTAIEDYKSPFTRVKVQLNPKNLGEVDLTIVQRGKNLHVNLSSNNAAINTLAMNASELKTQLNNSGINNATLNFNNQNSNQDGSNQQFGQQQQRENEKQAHKEYNYFETQEQNEEILSSLEIIVPRYI